MPGRDGSCDSCLHWQRVKDGAVIGRCMRANAARAYTHFQAGCEQYEARRRQHSDGELAGIASV